jgi:cysteine synthase
LRSFNEYEINPRGLYQRTNADYGLRHRNPYTGQGRTDLDLLIKKWLRGGYIESVANDDNWKAHYKTTGPEIWNDTEGTVTHFVAAMGTTGTIRTSTYLKEKPTFKL